MRVSLLNRVQFRAFRSLPAPVVQVMRRGMRCGVTSQKMFQAEVSNKYGLEIGGPSNIFNDRGELPISRYVAGLDNCVFSLDTIWQGKRAEGKSSRTIAGRKMASTSSGNPQIFRISPTTVMTFFFRRTVRSDEGPQTGWSYYCRSTRVSLDV